MKAPICCRSFSDTIDRTINLASQSWGMRIIENR